MTSFIDSNVLISIINEDEEHHAWSIEKFNEAKASGPVVISNIVYCEFSAGIPTIDQVDTIIAELEIERIPPSNSALYDAGKAFIQYRNINNGPKLNVLPDYLIGAEANAENSPLITANDKDFRTYFPDLVLICPD